MCLQSVVGDGGTGMGLNTRVQPGYGIVARSKFMEHYDRCILELVMSPDTWYYFMEKVCNFYPSTTAVVSSTPSSVRADCSLCSLVIEIQAPWSPGTTTQRH